MIKLVRVDHRLLHGQVAFAWTKNLGADCILIANDAVAKDKLRMAALKMAAPSGVKIVIKNIADSIQALHSGVTDKYNLMIILESIKDVDILTKEVSNIKTVNLGGVKAEEGKQQISMAVFVSPEEKDILRQMNDRGIYVEVKMVPEDKGQNAINLINN
ncbi:MAG: PTS sugar transporter subunit IIB [Erysipelotrichaceae bacterium]|nr:PTS sugar transporter subunit IIB [Erysipelotrichaceae bacterium]MDY5251428.1 PTS sugar transporter subunit IIB [Erysipelotrichaceae bacterium]